MQTTYKSPKKKSFVARLIENSLIASLLTFLSVKLHSFFTGGFVSRIFTVAERDDSIARNSFIFGIIGRHHSTVLFSAIRRGFSNGVENSSIVKLYRRLLKNIAGSSVRSIGVFLISGGLYSAVAYIFRIFKNSFDFSSYGDIAVIAIMIAAAFPLLLSGKSNGRKFCESAFFSFVFFDLLSINPMSVSKEETTSRQYSFSFFSGLAFGMISLFTSATDALAVLGIIILSLVIIYSPESGINISVFLIPFVNSNGMYLVLVLTLISYFLKLLRSKRNLDFKFEDVVALLAALLVALFIPVDGFWKTLCICSIYIMISNMVRNTALFHSAGSCLVLGLTVNMFMRTAAFSLAEFGLEIDEILGFSTGRLTEPDDLLLIVSSIAALFAVTDRYIRLPAIIKSLFFATTYFNLISSASDEIWLVAAICVFVYSVMFSQKIFNVLFVYCLIIPVVWIARSIIACYTDISGIHIYSLSGINNGIGEILFGSGNSGNGFYGEIFGSIGVFGIAIFAVLLFLLFSRSLVSSRRRSGGIRNNCAALTASLLAIMLHGVFSGNTITEHNMLLFWALCGLISATKSVLPMDAGEADMY